MALPARRGGVAGGEAGGSGFDASAAPGLSSCWDGRDLSGGVRWLAAMSACVDNDGQGNAAQRLAMLDDDTAGIGPYGNAARPTRTLGSRQTASGSPITTGAGFADPWQGSDKDGQDCGRGTE